MALRVGTVGVTIEAITDFQIRNVSATKAWVCLVNLPGGLDAFRTSLESTFGIKIIGGETDASGEAAVAILPNSDPDMAQDAYVLLDHAEALGAVLPQKILSDLAAFFSFLAKVAERKDA